MGNFKRDYEWPGQKFMHSGPFVVTVLDQFGSPLWSSARLTLNAPFAIFNQKICADELFAHPILIPGSNKLFFPAGVFQLLRTDESVFLTQDGKSLFRVESNDIILRLSSSCKPTILYNSLFIHFQAISLQVPFTTILVYLKFLLIYEHTQ